jgi:UDPglucose--hexose-1-phosphate uridylyltransferase
MSSEKIRELAVILKDTVRRVKSVFPECAYNFIVHSSPVNGDSDNVEDYHWHIEFMPKLTRVAGFEWGTGFYAVSTSPEEAAKYLLNVQ